MRLLLQKLLFPDGNADAVVVTGREARAHSAEGQVASMALEDLLKVLRSATMGTGEIVLPDGVKAVLSSGSITILVHQTPPAVHNLKWIAAQSPRNYGTGTVYRRVRVALPYLIVLAVFWPGDDGALRISGANEAFFRTEPLSSLDDDLYYPALLNCSRFDDPDDRRPLSWVCTQHMDRSYDSRGDECRRVRQGFRALMGVLLEDGFNRSSEEHEAGSWFQESARVIPQVSTVEEWEKATEEDPLFVLEVPWLPTGKTVRQVADRIFHIHGRRRSRQVTTSTDLARIIFNAAHGT